MPGLALEARRGETAVVFAFVFFAAGAGSLAVVADLAFAGGACREAVGDGLIERKLRVPRFPAKNAVRRQHGSEETGRRREHGSLDVGGSA